MRNVDDGEKKKKEKRKERGNLGVRLNLRKLLRP